MVSIQEPQSQPTMTKSITIQLPLDYQIPELFHDASPDLIATALTLGAESCRIMKDEAYAKVRAETHTELTAQIKRASDQEISRIRKERDEAHTILEHTAKRLRTLEQSSSEQQERIRQEERRNREEIAREKDSRIHSLEAQLTTATRSLTDGFQTLKEQLIRTTTGSTNKGREGEHIVEELLKTSYGTDPSFDLTPVGKEGHKGDHIMIYQGAKFLWEVKNYSRMVTKDEVEKLHRDMRENQDMAMGIMISLSHGIAGHTKAGDIDIEFIDAKRCIIYISNFHLRQDKVFYLQSLRPLFESVAKASKESAPTDTQEIESLQAKATLVRALLQNHQGSVQRHYISLLNHKKRSEQMFAELTAFLKESEGQVKEMLRVTLGTSGELENQTKEIQNLPERVFKKMNAVDMNEKERRFVEWLLSEVTLDEDESVAIKDIVDKAKEASFSEKEVRGYRETLFQDVAWQKGGKLVIGLKWKD
jgi:hypothetical protein